MNSQKSLLSFVLVLFIFAMMCIFGYFYYQKDTLAAEYAAELRGKNVAIDSLQKHTAYLKEQIQLYYKAVDSNYVVMDSLRALVDWQANELRQHKGLVAYMDQTEIPGLEKRLADSTRVLVDLRQKLALEKEAHKASRKKYVADMTTFQAQIHELETTALNLTANQQFAVLIDSLAKTFSREHRKAAKLADSLLVFVGKYPRYLNTNQYDWPENIMEYFQSRGVQFTVDQIAPDEQMALLLKAYDTHMQHGDHFAAGKAVDAMDTLLQKNPELRRQFASDITNLPTKKGTLDNYLNSPRYQQQSKIAE